MWITARCKYFWQTVPFLQRDPSRPEDIITTGPDHAGDAARYAVMELLEQTSAVKNDKFRDHLLALHPLSGIPGHHYQH